MKLSYTWLKDYIECDLNAEQIAEAMTAIGIEVDSVTTQEAVEGGLKGVVVAEVVECEDHPDSDHLHITKINDGSDELLTVVCGASNVAKGEKVLLAKIGTVLPGDFKIKKSKIRGVESFGMLCAEDELGIGKGHEGIMLLPKDAQVGQSAKEYLNLKEETVIEYEITANRIDAASHWGVARDIYAYLKLNNLKAQLRPAKIADLSINQSKDYKIKIENQSKDLAPIYNGLYINNVEVKESPEWLQERLLSMGVKPTNNIVDISNYVLFELGQPLHIFDADKIDNNKIIIRKAVEGEVLTTLDDVERKLSAEDLVIADENKALCLAGVMGGLNSSVTVQTKNIFIEGAFFDPVSVRKTAKRHIIHSDSSFRFERTADISASDFAVKRAAYLIKDILNVDAEESIQRLENKEVKRKEVELDYNSIESLIGKKIGHKTIDTILEALNYEFVERKEEIVKVAVPTYMIDVERECDVVEEILRVYGYDNIELPSQMKMSVNPSLNPDPEHLRNSISNFFAANGFVEIMNNSLTKSSYYDNLKTFPKENCVELVNPLSSDLNVMRQTLILGGLEVIAYNQNRQVTSLRTFEYGSVYKYDNQSDRADLKSYNEQSVFTLMLAGDGEKSWISNPRKSDYYQLKSYFELLLKRFGASIYDLDTEEAPSDIFLQGLQFTLKGQKSPLAVIGEINPKLKKSFSIKSRVFALEINWPQLLELIKRNKVKFQALAKFPEVKRDLAILLDEDVKYSDLRASAYKAGKKLLKQVSLFDLYRGDKIPAGKKQYALSFILQDNDKTLLDSDIEKVMKKILSTFENQYGATLR